MLLVFVCVYTNQDVKYSKIMTYANTFCKDCCSDSLGLTTENGRNGSP
jgi:hypothetical protein